MKKPLILFALLCLVQFAVAQNLQIIKGVIIDSAKNEPVGYATIALQTAGTSKPVKSTLSKDNGSFLIEGLPTKAYKLVIASVGFKNKIIFTDSTKAVVDMGRILMQTQQKDLKEVSVTALRPVIKQEIDKLNYDVQADPDSKSLTALDMLRKVPMISVDATDQIRLKGNTDYKILINNKPSALVARNPSDILKAMPAANIERIEVITTPPAKYDAEGIGGIINIITKRNADQGYNGTVSTRYNSVYGGSANLNLTVKQGKFGVTGFVGYNDQKERITTSDKYQQFLSTNSQLRQHTEDHETGHGAYSSIELSYEIDSLNLLTGQLENWTGKYHSVVDQSSIQANALTIPIQSFISNSSSQDSYGDVGLGLNYQLGFKKNKQQLLTFSYKFNRSPETQTSDVLINNILNYNVPSYQQYNNSGTREHTIQTDYVQPLKKLVIEGGLKAILRTNFSDFEGFKAQPSVNVYVPDPTQTNQFDYQQDVYSLYNTYQLKLTKWSFKGGLRLEHTNVDAHFVSAGSVASQNYNSFIPSVSIQRLLKGASITAGFTNRISRPGIWQLNPFVNRSDPRFISTGNPNLSPVVNHSFSLNFSKYGKVNINSGLSYNFSNNTIQNLNTLQGDTVTISTFRNIGSSKNASFNVGLSWPVNTKLSINMNAYSSYVWLTGFYNGLAYSNSGLQANGYASASYKLKTGWRFSASMNGYSPYISLQGRSFSNINSSFSVNKELLNKALNLNLNVANPFSQYLTTRREESSPDYYLEGTFRNYYRNISASVNYKFGKFKGSIKKNERSINNDDVSGGKSGGN